MEVEVKLCCWLNGTECHVASHFPPTKYPVCAPPQGADPCSNFKWLLRREGLPFPISPRWGRLPSYSSQHQDDKDPRPTLHEPLRGCGGRGSESEATVREIN